MEHFRNETEQLNNTSSYQCEEFILMGHSIGAYIAFKVDFRFTFQIFSSSFDDSNIQSWVWSVVLFSFVGDETSSWFSYSSSLRFDAYNSVSLEWAQSCYKSTLFFVFTLFFSKLIELQTVEIVGVLLV